MQTVYDGTLEECIHYVHSEEKKDETLYFDIVQSEISGTLFYVKELNGYDAYSGSF